MSDALAAPSILTPHALPMFRDLDPGRGTKRKADKDRQDPRKSRRPELPVTGPGRGGRVGASATQHVVQNLVRDTTRDQDVCTLSLLLPQGSECGHIHCRGYFFSNRSVCASFRCVTAPCVIVRMTRLPCELISRLLLETHSFLVAFFQPREALLKYAEMASNDPQWTAGGS